MKCPSGSKGVVVTFNAGTSEGAKKGWESRQGGDKEKSKEADEATKYAKDLEADPESSDEAISDAHQEAAGYHQSAMMASKKGSEAEKYHKKMFSHHAKKVSDD